MGWFSDLFSRDVKPKITIYEATAASVVSELSGLGIAIPFGNQDSTYYYTTEWGWQQAVKYIRKKHKFPSYAAEIRDCDLFALLMKALAEEYFGLTTCGYTNGRSPRGSHAFNKVRVASEPFPSVVWKDIEPQNGSWPADYTTTKILI